MGRLCCFVIRVVILGDGKRQMMLYIRLIAVMMTRWRWARSHQEQQLLSVRQSRVWDFEQIRGLPERSNPQASNHSAMWRLGKGEECQGEMELVA